LIDDFVIGDVVVKQPNSTQFYVMLRGRVFRVKPTQ